MLAYAVNDNLVALCTPRMLHLCSVISKLYDLFACTACCTLQEVAISLMSKQPKAHALRQYIIGKRPDTSASTDSSATTTSAATDETAEPETAEAETVEDSETGAVTSTDDTSAAAAADDDDDDDKQVVGAKSKKHTKKAAAAKQKPVTAVVSEGLGISMRIDADDNGRINLRGEPDMLPKAIALLEEFKNCNYTAEMQILAQDDHVLQSNTTIATTASSSADSSATTDTTASDDTSATDTAATGGSTSSSSVSLLKALERDYNCSISIIRPRSSDGTVAAVASSRSTRDPTAMLTVRIRGSQDNVNKVKDAIHYAIYGTSSSSSSGTDTATVGQQLSTVVLMSLDEQAFGPLIGKGGSNIKKVGKIHQILMCEFRWCVHVVIPATRRCCQLCIGAMLE
jgi:hypothetical protein